MNVSQNCVAIERLKYLLNYDPSTGIFRWNVTQGKSLAGTIAGHMQKRGYIVLCIDRKSYYGHRLAWFYMTGEWPIKLVDHENEIKSDNSWKNLRPANHSQNHQNRRKADVDNSTGVLGVHWNKRDKRFIAQIRRQGEVRHLGSFLSVEGASTAYLAAKAQLHEFAPIGA